MTQEKLDTQRDVVMNERRQRVDNQPYGRAGERLHELLYPADHPYHWPVIGYMDDIAAATLEDVADVLPHLLHAEQRGAHAWPATSSPTTALAADRGLVRRHPGRARRWRRWCPPARPWAASGAASAARRRPAARASTSPSAPRPTASGRGTRRTCSPRCSPAGKSSPLYRDLVYERQIAQDVGASVGPHGVRRHLHAGRHRPPRASPPRRLEEALLGPPRGGRRRAAPAAADLERARNRMLTELLQRPAAAGQPGRPDLPVRHLLRRSRPAR